MNICLGDKVVDGIVKGGGFFGQGPVGAGAEACGVVGIGFHFPGFCIFVIQHHDAKQAAFPTKKIGNIT